MGGKGLYREGKVGGNYFRPKKRIKEEGRGLFREGKAGVRMTLRQRSG